MNLKKKVGLGGVNPTGHRNLVLIPVHHAQKLNALLPLRMSLQKQPIQILYYLTQLQMTSNNM